MNENRIKGEMRTDLDCEISSLPGRQWAEAVFVVDKEEIIMEISAEQKTIIALAVGEEVVWKGTLEGLKMLLRGEIKGR